MGEGVNYFFEEKGVRKYLAIAGNGDCLKMENISWSYDLCRWHLA